MACQWPTTRTGRKLKFLRRVPVDPTTGSDEWGLRAYQDKPDSTSWSGQNVYDVYSKNQGTGLDGTKYRDWDWDPAATGRLHDDSSCWS